MPSKIPELKIDPEFKAELPALTPEEYELLEKSLLADGCRDALVVWAGQGVIVDGHHRYEICQKHSMPYRVDEREFASRDHALLWICETQGARRNLTKYALTAKVLKRKGAIEEENRKRQAATQFGGTAVNNCAPPQGKTRDVLAAAAGVSHRIVEEVEFIEENAPPSIKAAANTGGITTHRAFLITTELKGAVSEIVQYVTDKSIDSVWRVKVLKRLFKSRGTNGSTDTFDEIIRTDMIQVDEDTTINFLEAGESEVEKALKLKARYHARIKREAQLADQDPGVVDTDSLIVCGDCTSLSWPADVDLIIADPPYGLSRNNQAGVREGKGDWDELPYTELHTFNERWLRLAIAALKDGGSIFVFGSVHNIFSVGHILKSLGCYIVRDIVWNKPFVQRAVNLDALVPAHEIIIWARKGDHHKCYLDEITRDVWDIQPAAPFKHPTEKPEALISRIVLMASDPGDLVVDPFLGSGTTSAVAAKLKRQYWGVEKDGYWHRIATQRTREAGILQSGEEVAA